MQNNTMFKSIHFVAFILVVIGALNWGLVGVADFNLVAAIFGEMGFSRVIYTLVGLAALIGLHTEFMMARTGEKKERTAPTRSAAQRSSSIPNTWGTVAAVHPDSPY